MMPAVKAAILCDIATGACVAPAAPSGLGATQPAPETTVSWTDNATNETGYEIRYQNITQGGGFVAPTSLPADSTGTVIVITGAADGDSIEIQVRAVNGLCASAWISVTVVASINN
jgi:predicted RNA-binding protein with TRAM domain